MSGRNRIYGPVPSRRLGLSLGIDLAEYKHCPLDCIYCQLKETTRLDTLRESPEQVAEIVRQVHEKISTGPMPDHLTLGGSGEPTLFADLGDLIRTLHREFDIPVALLTNGVLFGDPAVRADAALADVVLPSLDAWDEDSFRLINRPCQGLDFESYITGLETFRGEYGGEIWLEIMLLEGVSDDPGTVAKLAALAARIRPDRIQLNTPIRPPATSLARPVSRAAMEELAAIFKPCAEVAADFPEKAAESLRHVTENEVLETITRRPCTTHDVAVGLGAAEDEVCSALERLRGDGRVVIETVDGRVYFKLPV